MSTFEILRDRLDLAELAGQYTELRPSGKSHVGRCPHPEHEDKNPSFHVYPDRRFYCFGCGWHGDVTDLWAAVSGSEPGIGAALTLAREYEIELPAVDEKARKHIEARRQKEAEYMWEAKKLHQTLAQHPKATAYWEKRGFGEELRQRFLLGADDEVPVIPFWNRGRVQSLIRRNMKDEPKYILQNAEEFVSGYRPLFIPGSAYGEVLLVEGYVDALALVALGYSAIAIGGTHANKQQMEQLRRVPGHIYILPDNDDRGDKAAKALARELYPKALLCPPNYERETTDDD